MRSSKSLMLAMLLATIPVNMTASTKVRCKPIWDDAPETIEATVKSAQSRRDRRLARNKKNARV